MCSHQAPAPRVRHITSCSHQPQHPHRLHTPTLLLSRTLHPSPYTAPHTAPRTAPHTAPHIAPHTAPHTLSLCAAYAVSTRLSAACPSGDEIQGWEEKVWGRSASISGRQGTDAPAVTMIWGLRFRVLDSGVRGRLLGQRMNIGFGDVR